MMLTDAFVNVSHCKALH